MDCQFKWDISFQQMTDNSETVGPILKKKTDLKFPFLFVDKACWSWTSFASRVPIVREGIQKIMETRSSWLNCALRDDEAVYWVSIGHYEAVAVGN